METRPPALSGAIVRLLVPPACREHVVGDLWERYRSPGQFVRDAIQTVPLVVFSQMRRVFDPLYMLMCVLPAFVFFGGLLPGTAAAYPGWMRAAFPAAANALALLLRDTYRSTDRWTPRSAIVDGLAGVAAALLTQGVAFLTAPAWLVDGRSLVVGAIGTQIGVFALRLRARTDPADRLALSAEGRVSMDVFARDVTRFEQMIRHRNAFEQLAGLLVVIGFSIGLWREPGLFTRAGFALGIAGTLLVMYRFRTRANVTPVPLSGDIRTAILAYRTELMRQRQLLATVTRWYLLPLTPGMILLAIGQALRQQQLPATLRVLGLFLAVVLVTRALNLRAAAKAQEKIDLLTTALRNH